MSGMHNGNGQRIDDELEHIRQSVRDILTTPLGSRVMRRDYGSLIPELIDQPLNDATLLRAYAATVIALTRWEPRIRITVVRRSVSASQHGLAALEIAAQTTAGQPLPIEVTLV